MSTVSKVLVSNTVNGFFVAIALALALDLIDRKACDLAEFDVNKLGAGFDFHFAFSEDVDVFV